MSEAEAVVKLLCESYADAVNASDSGAYGRLFASDAIRMPPGSEPEHGAERIRQSEQTSYDAAKLSIRSVPRDALQVGDNWIYAIADVEGSATAHSGGGEQSSFRATKTWLLHRQPSGDWLIKRQMWNLQGHADSDL